MLQKIINLDKKNKNDNYKNMFYFLPQQNPIRKSIKLYHGYTMVVFFSIEEVEEEEEEEKEEYKS